MVKVTSINFRKILSKWPVCLKAQDKSDTESKFASCWSEECLHQQKVKPDFSHQSDQMDELKPWALDEVKRLAPKFNQHTAKQLAWRQHRKRKLIWACLFVVAILVILSAILNISLLPLAKNHYQIIPREQPNLVLSDSSLLHLHIATKSNNNYSIETLKIELVVGQVLFNVLQVPDRSPVIEVVDLRVVLSGTAFDLQLGNNAVLQRRAANEMSGCIFSELRVVAGESGSIVTGRIKILDQQTISSQCAQTSEVRQLV